MYELTVESHFDSAHCLEGYQGVCAQFHGHTWHVSVTVGATTLDELGISVDFKKIRSALDDITSKFDHQVLNKLDMFKDKNPTAENIAQTIYDEIATRIDEHDAQVLSVSIVEGESNRLTYRP